MEDQYRFVIQEENVSNCTVNNQEHQYRFIINRGTGLGGESNKAIIVKNC